MPVAAVASSEHVDAVLLTAVVETTHEHLLITDREGRILRASPSCGAVYGMTAEAMCATTVGELERRGVLSPSVTLKVLSTQRPQRVMQTTSTGRRVLAEAHPVFIDGRLERVVSRSRDTTDLRHLQDEYSLLTRHLAGHLRRQGSELSTIAHDDAALAVRSPAMRDVVDVLRRVAQTDATVMLLGETGVGKTLLARQVHRWSPRRDGPFIDVNCSAIPETLFESEMFGSMPGAFSGAPPQGRPGLLEQAQGGTLLLDEIGELPLAVQAKLLKALQDGVVMRLGDTGTRQLDFRLIVATNQDLATLVEAGSFRLDLFYRLNVVPVSLPPLRERREEIPALVEMHMTRLNERYGETRVIDPSLWGELMRSDWPGNVRELENYLERQWLAGSSRASRVGESGPRLADTPAQATADQPASSLSLKDALARTEKDCLQRAMAGARSTYDIAKRLQISQPGVVRKLRKHGLSLRRA